MPKSPCPPGQTRNRVTKTCRDKKKPGPRPGTRKNKNLKHTGTLQFRVQFHNNDINDLPIVSDHKAKVIKWYKQFMDNYKEDGLEIRSMKYIRSNIFQISYRYPDTIKEFINGFLEAFVDSDDDGNYPIRIGKNEYLVVGEMID